MTLTNIFVRLREHALVFVDLADLAKLRDLAALFRESSDLGENTNKRCRNSGGNFARLFFVKTKGEGCREAPPSEHTGRKGQTYDPIVGACPIQWNI